MATKYSVGHGQRRRAGNTKSSYTEAAGKSMARKHATTDEAMSQAAGMGSPRATMGMDAYNVSAAPALVGTQMPKKNLQAGDPTGMGTKVNHVNIPYNEKLGASYRVTVPFTPTIDPAAGPTMQSARVVPSIAGRENPNFESGIQGASSY